MTLNQFAAEHRRAIYESLLDGNEPGEGSYDAATLREARTRGTPQMGATRYEPDAMFFEFIYPDPGQTALILTVRLSSPERIVFMPVPTWVVENIWQGDITGSFHFETESKRLLGSLADELEPESNRQWFDRQPAKRRE